MRIREAMHCQGEWKWIGSLSPGCHYLANEGLSMIICVDLRSWVMFSDMDCEMQYLSDKTYAIVDLIEFRDMSVKAAVFVVMGEP